MKFTLLAIKGNMVHSDFYGNRITPRLELLSIINFRRIIRLPESRESTIKSSNLKIVGLY